VEQLRQAGLPEELSWLPLVESGFNVKAFSRARALGLWQFIPSTGYKYGLKRDYWVDERMDVEKSTKAAIAYLKQLHEIFGDWLTVLAAYNCGEGRVLKVISRQHMNYLDNFWDLYRQLPSETSRYVPRFIATLHIIKNPGKYGMDLGEGLDECVPYETVEVNKCMKLTDVARNLSVSEDTLVFLNSELRYKTTPDKEYDLKIPSGTKNRFMVVVNEIPKSKRPGGPEFVRHKVKKGEALSTIARRYKSSVKAIMAANHITSKHKIRAGNWIKVPVKGYSSYNYSKEKVTKRTRTVIAGKPLSYKVKSGDSLWLLARRFDTTVSEIKRINNLNCNKLNIGQIIKIRGGGSSARTSYTIKKGDNLYMIARKNNIKLEDLLELNNLSRKTKIYPGQIISIEK
jgi:membrane-bound lytic murein transglycosylase D